jgi:hypothetical protein
MRNKAQVTVYIIIGIVILFSIATAIYVANRMLAQPGEISAVDRPIQDYVESCIQQVGAEALVKMGAHAGYLDPGAPELDIFVSDAPAEGDALLVSEITREAVPYWFYMSTKNDCKECLLESLQPPIEQVKEQVDGYVELNLEKCLNSFEPFLEQGYVFDTGPVSSDVLLAEERTRFVVEYPVEIKKLDTTTRIEQFAADVDVPFKRMYELASEITAQERDAAFLESVLFHFISLHTGLEMSKLPPLGGITHDKVLVTWFKPMVEDNVKQLLLSYVPLIQLHGTKDAEQIKSGENAFEQGFYKALYLRFLKQDYPFDVDFMFFEWPFYFDITPRNGDILSGEVHVQEFPYNFAPAFQTNYYEFYYDVSAPVLVEIRDSSALKGAGYSFLFALEANVRDNKDFIEWNKGEGTVGYWDPANAVVETKESETTPGVCSEKAGSWFCDITEKSYSEQLQCVQNCFVSKTKRVPFRPVKKLFNDEEQKVSNTVKISVLDAVTGQGVNEVGVLFTCGRYQSAALGGTNLKGELKTKMPVCINGQLSFDKDGYAKKIIPFTVKPDDRKDIEVVLEPEAVLETTIKKYPIQVKNLRELEYAQEPEPQLSTSYADIDSWESLGMSALTGFSDQVISPLKFSMHWEEEGYKVGREQKNMMIYDRYCCDAPESLNASYQAILMVEKIPESPLEPKYFQTVMLDGPQQGSISMVPGVYKVTGMLIDKEGFVIQPGCQEICLEYDTDTGYYAEEIVEGTTDIFNVLPDEKPDCKKWGYFPENAITARPSLMGGVQLDNATGYWNVTRADLNKGAVEFYFIQTLKPTCTIVQDCVLDVCVDVAEIQATGPYSLKYREYLEPEFR